MNFQVDLGDDVSKPRERHAIDNIGLQLQAEVSPYHTKKAPPKRVPVRVLTRLPLSTDKAALILKPENIQAINPAKHALSTH